ncbi:MAG: hypothetical protein U0Q11_07425 [Vicinamibacterales bacterium]
MSVVDSSSSHIERLWTASDGTFCVLTTDSAPPSYTLALMRGTEVLRERRLYGLATAQMLAMGWRETAESREQFLARLLAHGRSKRDVAQGSGISSGEGMNH